MKKRLFFLLLLSVSTTFVFGQDRAESATYYNNQFRLFPAVTGIEESTNVQGGFQLIPTKGNLYQTYFLSVFGRVPNTQGSYGMTFANLYTPIFRYNDLQITGSYTIDLDEDVNLSIAPTVGVMMLELHNPLTLNKIGNSSYIPSLGFSLFYQNNNTYLAASGLRLGNFKTKLPIDSIDTYSRNYIPQSFHFVAGHKFEPTENVDIEPSVMFSLVNKDMIVDIFSQFHFYETFWFGGGYKSSGAVTGAIGLNLLKKYQASYSFYYYLENQYTPQNYAYITNGVHQLTLGLKFLQ